MKKSIINLFFGSVLAVGISASSFAQTPQNPSSKVSIEIRNGSVAQNLKTFGIDQKDLSTHINKWLGLSENYSFERISSQRDKLGFIQEKYRQYFKGIPIKDGMVVVHFKDGKANSLNGRVSVIDEQIVTNASVSAKDAIQTAQEELMLKKVLNETSSELIIYKNRFTGENVLAWDVKIDGIDVGGKLNMYHVFISAEDNKMIDKISRIAHVDVPASGKTLYKGEREFTVDSFAGGYRLIDNGRAIYTYDVGGVAQNSDTTSPYFFDTMYDITNDSTYWDKIAYLMSIELTTASPTLMTGLGQTTFLGYFVADETPVDILNFNALTFNPLFGVSGPANLPIVGSGLYLTLPKPSYMAGFAKAGVNFSTFEVQILDSAYFEITDKTLGTHAWSGNGSTGSYTMEEGENYALDAHWGMEKTHDYYLEKHGRSSYDGNGSPILNYMNGMVQAGFTQSNAAALPDPYNSMVYGLGDGDLLGPVVGLDVMGHEFTHLITSVTSNLDYQGESGALNESFSDMLATAIEFYTHGDTANWNIGDGVVLQAPGFLRSMSDPKILAASGNPNFPAQPDTYKGQYWASTTGADNGGVHTNSGVGNKWFYLLTEGGTGTNDKQWTYNVTGIGMEKAEQIAYRTLTSYLTPTSQYQDAYYAALQAADDLYGDTSQAYQSVRDAWVAVGVLDSISAGINNINPLDVKINVFPNPTTSKITIQSDIHQNLKGELTSILGERLQSISIKMGENILDLKQYSKGIYILTIPTEKGNIVRKIILE